MLHKMEYEIIKMQESDYEEYKYFIDACEDSLIDHTLGFKEIIENNFGYRSCYLLARKERDIVGVLPLFETKSILGGKRYISIPYSVASGFLVKDQRCIPFLLNTAKDMIKDDCRYLEIRQRKPINSDLQQSLVVHREVTNFYLSMDKSIDELWKSLPKSSVRWAVTKAEKNSVAVKAGNSELELNVFYDLYLNTRKQRGIPAYPRQFFKDIISKFPIHSKIYISYKDNQPLAAIFILYHRQEMRYAFSGASSKKEHLMLQPYHILFWQAIKDGKEKGYKSFDLSSSTATQDGGGIYDFKKKWSDSCENLYHYFYAFDKSLIPSDLSNAHHFIRKVWKKLPKSIIQLISKPVIKQYA